MTTTEKVLAISQWFSERPERPMGMVIVPHQDGYEIGLSDGATWQEVTGVQAGDALCDVLRLAVSGANAPALITTSIPAQTQLLRGLGLDGSVVSKFTDDMESLTYTTGLVFEPQATAAATAMAAVSRQRFALSRDVPAYYQRVAVPYQRLVANAERGTGPRFSLRYAELLVRVIAKYSHEPVLMRQIESDDVLSHLVEVLREAYPDADHDFARQCLIYVATGYDRDFFEERFGEFPAAADTMLTAQLDRLIPAVRMMAITLWQEAYEAGVARTLYGRQLPATERDRGKVLWFILGGTVEDILSVATVTLANNGIHVQPSLWRSDAERMSIRGTLKKKTQRDELQLIAQLAPLMSPLSPVPLAPVVVLED